MDNQLNQPNSDEDALDIQTENEIRKLMMQAESGAVFKSAKDLPPELEQAFLRHVQAFEKAFQDSKPVKVYDLIGRPEFKPVGELSETDLPSALSGMLEQLRQHQIELVDISKYDRREIYRFITEEFFLVETDDVNVPGMIRCFSYEEFHPDHAKDITQEAERFIEKWLQQNCDSFQWLMNMELVMEDGSVRSRTEVLHQLGNFFEGFDSFRKEHIIMGPASFEWDEKEEKGMGNLEGYIKYDAIMENGDVINYEGSFKLYMINEAGVWSVVYFIFPGFVW